MADNNTPPADDVREALARAMRPDLDWDLVCDSEHRDVQIAHSIPRDNARKAAERVLAAFEVRPRGTVTEPTNEQVLAGLNAEGPASAAAPSLDFYAAGNIARMRNVLRAAREVRNA